MLNLVGLHVLVVLYFDIIFKIYLLYVTVASVHGLIHLTHVSWIIQNMGVSSDYPHFTCIFNPIFKLIF